jgi:hypothetical protein
MDEHAIAIMPMVEVVPITWHQGETLFEVSIVVQVLEAGKREPQHTTGEDDPLQKI